MKTKETDMGPRKAKREDLTTSYDPAEPAKAVDVFVASAAAGQPESAKYGATIMAPGWAAGPDPQPRMGCTKEQFWLAVEELGHDPYQSSNHAYAKRFTEELAKKLGFSR